MDKREINSLAGILGISSDLHDATDRIMGWLVVTHCDRGFKANNFLRKVEATRKNKERQDE